MMEKLKAFKVNIIPKYELIMGKYMGFVMILGNPLK